MTWLAIRLFMGKALTAVLNALRWLMAHPWQAACLVAVCAALWQYRGKQAALSDLAACETKSAQLSAAIDAANKLAEQARAKSVTIAKDADNDHKERAKVSDSRTSAFVAARRLPEAPASVSAPEAGEGAGNAEGPATEAVMVAVSEADVRICAANYDYALTAFQWTQALQAQGLAD